MITTSVNAAQPAYGPGASAPERSTGYASASVDASARATFRDQLRAGSAAEEKAEAAKLRAALQHQQQVPDPMRGLSTVAVAGAMASTPAALNMMREIAMASANGQLSDAERRALQDEYAQLSAHVVTTVGSASAGEQAAMQQREKDLEEDAYRMYRESSDDRRSTLTQTSLQPVESTVQQPVTHMVTMQRSVMVADGHGQQRDPRPSFHTQELHVGTDSYEPVSARQRISQPTMPESMGHWDNHAETRSVSVVEASQVTHFVEVAQTQLIPPVKAFVA